MRVEQKCRVFLIKPSMVGYPSVHAHFVSPQKLPNENSTQFSFSTHFVDIRIAIQECPTVQQSRFETNYE